MNKIKVYYENDDDGSSNVLNCFHSMPFWMHISYLATRQINLRKPYENHPTNVSYTKCYHSSGLMFQHTQITTRRCLLWMFSAWHLTTIRQKCLRIKHICIRSIYTETVRSMNVSLCWCWIYWSTYGFLLVCRFALCLKTLFTLP